MRYSLLDLRAIPPREGSEFGWDSRQPRSEPLEIGQSQPLSTSILQTDLHLLFSFDSNTIIFFLRFHLVQQGTDPRLFISLVDLLRSPFAADLRYVFLRFHRVQQETNFLLLKMEVIFYFTMRKHHVDIKSTRRVRLRNIPTHFLSCQVNRKKGPKYYSLRNSFFDSLTFGL